MGVIKTGNRLQPSRWVLDVAAKMHIRRREAMAD
jgi:hypothetical protein